jgi:Mn2+/Fe2+ NRAMP family transporter
MRRLASVALWSVIAAAFIGPGTVTTAATAGSRFGFDLLWALLFSTVACLVLQEASARLTVVSGRNLGEALRDRYPAGWPRAAMLVLVLGAIVLGCAAYEAGNILGGVAGAALALPLAPELLALVSVAIAAVLLASQSPRRVAQVLSLLVAVMGLAFLTTALLLRPSFAGILRGSLWPGLPEGSSLIALGLVGTTVVPYNLFLGSGIARGQELGELRFGLAVAVLLGGAISAGVLVVGTASAGEMSFAKLAAILGERLGDWARPLFAAGLFAAGLSSAVTAPLAAAITARSLLAEGPDDPRWRDGAARYRAIWGGVLAIGLLFGVSGVQPIPVILVAQALNGILLPVTAVVLLLAVNDRRLMGEEAMNGLTSNAMMGCVTVVTVLLGAAGVVRAAARAAGWPTPVAGTLVAVGGAAALGVAVPVVRALWRLRRAGLRPAG